jgi:uncharacterized integral membrane protein
VNVVRTLRAVLLLVVLVTLIIFFAALNDMNPYPVMLPPFRLPIPPLWVVLASLLLGFLVGWVPSRVRIWSLNRITRRLQRRIEELEKPLNRYRADEPSAPIIPDRDAATTRKSRFPAEVEHG